MKIRKIRSQATSEPSARRIVHVLSSLEVGGAERFVIDLCTSQRRTGWEPHILSYGSPEDPLANVCQEMTIPVVHGKGIALSTLIKIRRLLSTAEIVHIHSPAVLKPLSVVFPLIGRTRVIYTRHGADPLNTPRWKYIHRIVKRFISVVTFVSAEGLQNFMSTFAWSDKKHLVIENGVVIPASIVEVGRTTKVRLAMVGRMVPLKHQITLLKAMSDLAVSQRERLSVDFFGDGECRENLESYALKELPDSVVRFHGNVSDRRSIYANIDLLVVTSETEGLSIAILEAMSYGIPVIATNVGGNPRLVQDGLTGRLFNYDDHRTLSSILSEVLDSPAILARWGVAARENVSDNFSIQKTTDDYDVLYRRD